MEWMKEKLPTILGIVIFLALGGLGYYFCFVQSEVYYSQIDNTKCEQIAAKEYKYTLEAYNAKGKRKELEFKTNRELREDAFLEFEVMLTRGVISWQEVFYTELPNDVQSQYEDDAEQFMLES